jgi:hypothetical protein
VTSARAAKFGLYFSSSAREDLGAGDRANVGIVAEGPRDSNYRNPEIFRDVLHPNRGQYPSSCSEEL